MAITLACSTELEAVNTMLQCIGSSPVNTLDGSGVVDAVTARQTLHNTSRDLQEQGWSFNTELCYTLAASLSGEIVIPQNCLKLDPVDTEELELVQRGLKLYDRKNHTFVIGRSVKVDLVLMLTWEDLPQVARRLISIRAARTFQAGIVGSDTLDSFTAKDELKALIAFKNSEANNADHNMLTGSYAVARVIVR